MTQVTKVVVQGARGPIGPASGPLGLGSVTAETISNDSGEQSAILDKLGAVSEADLASTSSSKGAGLLGFSHSATYGATTQGAKSKSSLSVKDHPYSATGDGSADDTAEFQAALDAMTAAPTEPLEYTGTALTGRGLRTLFIPKGRYKITATLIASAALSGIEVVGQGKDATTIEVHGDSVGFLKSTAYLNLTIRNLSIVHVASGDRATWTNKCFEFNGTGGGRNFHLYDVQIRGFNYQIYYSGTVNCDTTLAIGCDFFSANWVVYARNSQALINNFTLCSFYGPGGGFDIAGMGHTKLDSCNITLDGPWMKLYGQSGLWGPTAQFTFVNVKGEPTNWSGFASGSRSAIVTLDGDKSYIACTLRFVNSGFTSSVTFDTNTAYPQIEMTSNMRMVWEEGQIKDTAKIKLWPYQTDTFNRRNHRGLFFRGLRSCPLPTQITRESATSNNTTFPQVTYQECQGVNNITIGAPIGTYLPFPPTVDRPEHINCMGSDSHYYGVLSFGSALTHTLDFYGSHQCVTGLDIQVIKKVSGTDLTITTSLDNFATTLDTITIASSSNATYLDLEQATAVIGKVGADKLYVRCSGAEAYGYIYAKIRTA